MWYILSFWRVHTQKQEAFNNFYKHRSLTFYRAQMKDMYKCNSCIVLLRDMWPLMLSLIAVLQTSKQSLRFAPSVLEYLLSLKTWKCTTNRKKNEKLTLQTATLFKRPITWQNGCKILFSVQFELRDQTWNFHSLRIILSLDKCFFIIFSSASRSHGMLAPVELLSFSIIKCRLQTNSWCTQH